jgi:Undecaprenyl-phosphate glucose phosphotransferase
MRAIQILLDAVFIAAAWAISYYVRFYLIGSAQEGLGETFVVWLFPLCLLSLYFFLKNRQYDRRRLDSTTEEIMRLFRANALSVVSFVIVLYFFSEARISRLTIVLYAAFSTILLVFVRLMVRSFIRKLRRRGYLLETVFVAGDSVAVERYLEVIGYLPGTGLKVEGVFGAEGPRASAFARFDLSELESRIASVRPDRVVLAFLDPSAAFVTEFVRRHYDELFRIQVLVAENQALLGMSSEAIDDLHLMSLNEPTFSIPELTAKRALDLFGSGVGLLVLSPFLALLALLVRLSSPGPVFFGQERVGVDGKTFMMWKFRTMRVGTADEARGWTVENDPRRTRIGTFLRSTSLDEFPQLWNVFVGQMSLVGPRPEQTHFVEKFRREIPAYMLRHKMRAGITGWAQVSGLRGDTSLHKRIEYDLYYIRNWTIWFDIKILLMTVVRGFVNKNAY